MIALGAGPAGGQEAPQADFAKAVAALSERLGPTESGPHIESTDTAANAADLAVIEQALDQLGTPAFPLDGFASFEAVCDPLNRLSVRHLLDGAAELRRPADAPPPTATETQAFTARLQALQLRNAARYQDQMTVLSAGGLRCMVKHFPALAAFAAGLPPEQVTITRLNGIRQMRLGSMQSLLGFTTALRDPTTTAANKARLRAYLTEIAPPLAAALTPELRVSLTAQLDSLPPTLDREAQATTDALKAALAITTCEGLCGY
jgi:hypothetical protein